MTPAVTPRADSLWVRTRRFLLGENRRALLFLLAPTLVAIVLDVVLRARSIASFAPRGKAIWASSLLVSAAFWALPLWLASRLRSRIAIAMSIALLLPIATFAFVGQALHQKIFASYMGRDTLRLGLALRGDIGAWLSSWMTRWAVALVVVLGAAIAFGLYRIIRAARAHTRTPWLLVATFLGSLFCFWTDNVDSRFLQAALPDACFVHAIVNAVHATIAHAPRHGVSVRTPVALPPLMSERARPINVVLVITESVRADAMCSQSSPHCKARYLDDAASDRVELGKLTSQTPNTHSAFVALTTGLTPVAGFAAAHSAPVVWEIARAVGYRTAFISSQNPRYEDFGLFVSRAGIDRLVTGTDLGGVGHEQLGAQDERATEEALRFVRDGGGPFFAVVQLANTHWPYRVDPALQPFEPHSEEPFRDVEANHNHYRNSVLMQERLVASFIAELRAMDSWRDTVVLFVSDHGEQFREHGASFHNHSLYDEEVRVPGFIVGGALDAEMRASLATWSGRRTYHGDVRATVIDLFGVNATLPYAEMSPGRSLVRASTPAEPIALFATTTGVWDGDYAIFGAMRGERLLVGAPGNWRCYDIARDPAERKALPPLSCGPMLEVAERAFAH